MDFLQNSLLVLVLKQHGSAKRAGDVALVDPIIEAVHVEKMVAKEELSDLMASLKAVQAD